MEKPIALNIRLYNNPLRRRRLRAGLTASALCKEVPISQSKYGELEKMHISPKTKKGTWRIYVTRLADYWKTTEDVLFPKDLLRVYGYEVEFAVTSNEIKDIGIGLSHASGRMLTPEDFVAGRNITKELNAIVNRTILNDTDRLIFRMKFFEGLYLDEISNELSLSPLMVQARLDRGLKRIRSNLHNLVSSDSCIFELEDSSYFVNLEREQVN